MKDEGLYEPQGGPIILSQVTNSWEYSSAFRVLYLVHAYFVRECVIHFAFFFLPILFRWLECVALLFVTQIENEYGPMEFELGDPGRAYTEWAAKMALDIGTGVPWVMCKQDDAPDPIVRLCVPCCSPYSDAFSKNHGNFMLIYISVLSWPFLCVGFFILSFKLCLLLIARPLLSCTSIQ